ncbi:MAG: glycosyltransferase family 39 protein, partial [Opitutaceae bacterium]|nr:glycosyltransferase family 39 protein [Opitutaceae bacterium]
MDTKPLPDCGATPLASPPAEATAPPPTLPPAPAGKCWRVVFVCSLVVFAALLFARLGHYALWGDEAYTALFGKTIRQTGDTTVLVDGGKNVITAMFGSIDKLTVGVYERSNAPLPAWLIAGSTALLGDNALAARLLPALLGFLAFALLAWQTRRARHGALACALLAIACCCNVPLLLFMRQARYFGPAMFFVTVITLVYIKPRVSWRDAAVFTVATVGLYLTHYLSFFVFFVTLAVDYFAFKRRLDGFPVRRMLALLAPAAAICLVFLILLNPMQSEWIKDGGMHGKSGDGLREKLMLWWWQWRDMNTCEHVSFGMLVLTLGCAAWFRDRWLWRGIVAALVYVTVLTIVTPQEVKNNTTVADVRYLAPLLPLL